MTDKHAELRTAFPSIAWTKIRARYCRRLFNSNSALVSLYWVMLLHPFIFRTYHPIIWNNNNIDIDHRSHTYRMRINADTFITITQIELHLNMRIINIAEVLTRLVWNNRRPISKSCKMLPYTLCFSINHLAPTPSLWQIQRVSSRLLVIYPK